MDTASPKVSNGAIPIPKPLRLHPEANKRKLQCSTFKENKALLRAHLETTMNFTPCKIQCIFLQTFSVQIPHPWKMKFSLGAVMASRGESTHFSGKKEEKRRAGFPNSKPPVLSDFKILKIVDICQFFSMENLHTKYQISIYLEKKKKPEKFSTEMSPHKHALKDKNTNADSFRGMIYLLCYCVPIRSTV